MANTNRVLGTSLMIAILCLGCGVMQKSSTEEGAITEASDREIPGSHSPADLDPITAERWIDNVHLGRELDASGRVLPDNTVDTFREDDPIYVSMEVTDAPAGTLVKLVIHDVFTEEQVLSEERTVVAGRSHLNFSFSPEQLGDGDYKATVIVGDEKVAARSFTIDSRQA